MITLYGIPNCDTMRKSMKWLEEKGVDFEFHDYRKDGLKKSKVEEWAKQAGFEDLMNKKSATWRQLSDAEKAAAGKKSAAVKLMTEKPTLIKRPLIEKDGKYLGSGFRPEEDMWKDLGK